MDNEVNGTLLEFSAEDDSDNNSDVDNLKIVIESPNYKRKTPPKPSKTEQIIIDSIEDELQKRLDEKAAKTNLNTTHVKNIIKHIVTNEHVLTLVKNADNPTTSENLIPYEPKLTRAKAKELLSSSVPVPSVSWATPKHTSEVQVLFTEDLQEDSSGDEYIPGEEESEDDRDGSIVSDPPSVPPATPPSFPMSSDSCTQTNWTEDGVFKIPPLKSQEDTEEANIALRTRSKLCLSSTPLEVIEEAFIPPDITSDMYDMYCDNDDWMDFLKKFTRPLDEVANPTADEEQDPEYNILADEEIEEIDREELRVDKAVKVTKRELNDLIAELFDDSDFCTNEVETISKNCSDNLMENNEQEIVNNSEKPKSPSTDMSTQNTYPPEESTSVIIDQSDIFAEEKDVMIKRSQIPLLEQQMRQHVQMLTQNFILTYEHPELHHYSSQAKEYLLNLKYLGDGKQRSVFYTENLMKALQLVEDWEKLLATNNDEVKEMKKFTEKVLAECIQRHQGALPYVVTFPDLILKTISNSDVFIYPSLLPKIPFKSNKVFARNTYFTETEDELVAIGLEQFEPVVRENRKFFTGMGTHTLKMISAYINEYVMPPKDGKKIYSRIIRLKLPRCANNPIKYFFQHKRAPSVVHYVCPLHEFKVLPPCKRSPDQLPYQWKMFNYSNVNENQNNASTTAAYTPVVSQFHLLIQQLLPVTINVTCNVPVVNRECVPPPDTLPPPLVINNSRAILPKKSAPSIFENRRTAYLPFRKKRPIIGKATCSKVDPVAKFTKCLSQPLEVSKALNFFSDSEFNSEEESSINSDRIPVSTTDTMLPSMPQLCTPTKKYLQNEASSNSTAIVKDETITILSSNKGDSHRSSLPEISTISSSSFQQADTSTEIEFSRPTDDCQTVTSTCIESNSILPSSSQEVQPESTQAKIVPEPSSSIAEKNKEIVQSSVVKPPARKEPSGAEKKRIKLKKEFLANLSITAPEDPKIRKEKNEMFALAYYDKMRETLELEDYHKIMQILNDHEEGDAIELYKKIEKVLSPKYQELSDEFLLFLKEKEAAAVGQLVPWIKMNNRSKFLRKLEIYFKDQPAQLRKIYKCLTDLSQTTDVTMDKIKSTLLPMFKGNAVLSDLFMQNFLSERPPPSLLEGPYETIDMSKELSKPEGEEIYETITVPDTGDKYGGPSCICSCHQIEDPEFQSRYRHCIRCGTKFINGKVFVQSGRGLRPATVAFRTNSNEDHNLRLLGKAPTVTYPKKKRSETSPAKHVSPTKENAEEESDDEGDGKKKSKRKSQKKKPLDKSPRRSKEPQKKVIVKKGTTNRKSSNKLDRKSPTKKEYKTSTRKRTYPAKRSKEDDKKTEKKEVEEERVTVKPEANSGQLKRSAEEPMEWEDNPGVSSTELKANSPDQQTAESESEFCEESSQDNCESDSNSSASSINNQSQSDSNTEEYSWTREEDKIILETFQKQNDKEQAFEMIAKQLKNRTVSQISDRFQKLMALLLETLGNS